MNQERMKRNREPKFSPKVERGRGQGEKARAGKIRAGGGWGAAPSRKEDGAGENPSGKSQNLPYRGPAAAPRRQRTPTSRVWSWPRCGPAMGARGAQRVTGQVLPEIQTLHTVDGTWEPAHTASPHQPPPDPQTHRNLAGGPAVCLPAGVGVGANDAGQGQVGGRGARGWEWLGAGVTGNACWTQGFQGKHCLVLAPEGLQVQPGR